MHNITDGLAIGAAFATSNLFNFNSKKDTKLGITLTLSIFFHEIPHEIGDFSFLLKQNFGKFNALTSQIFSAIGALIGVYLSKIKNLYKK